MDAFEQDLVADAGVRHCVGAGGGADALELILRGAGAGPDRYDRLPAGLPGRTRPVVADRRNRDRVGRRRHLNLVRRGRMQTART